MPRTALLRPTCCQQTKGFARIGNTYCIYKLRLLLRHHSRNDTLFLCHWQKLMAIKSVAGYGYKHITGLHGAAINANACNGYIFAEQSAIGPRSYLLQCHLHAALHVASTLAATALSLKGI